MTRAATVFTASLLGSLFVFGCAQGGGGTDAGGGGGLDAGPRIDAFMPRPDSGPDPVPDAGATDAGATDAGATTDAGPSDAGPMTDGGRDAGRDAGSDAGPRDAGGGGCGESPCRLAPPQCGCGGGQACYPTTSGRECRAPGGGVEGAACSAAADCAAGLVCDGGLCARICLTNADCPGRGSECRGSVMVGPNTLATCTIPCEPATGAGCPSSMACRYFSGGGTYYTDCVSAGSTAPGAECSSNSDCGRNHTCVTILFDSACEQSCRFGESDCAVCIGFFDSTPTIDGTEYGFCG